MGTTDQADCDRGGVVPDVPAGLTAFQVSVATLFFSLPASDGFLLARGAVSNWPSPDFADGAVCFDSVSRTRRPRRAAKAPESSLGKAFPMHKPCIDLGEDRADTA